MPLESVALFCCDCAICNVALDFLLLYKKHIELISKCMIVSLKEENLLTKTHFLRISTKGAALTKS